ncbi:MAG TPA: SDR family oxidoreductase [Pseudonocardiaceae bacterium]
MTRSNILITGASSGLGAGMARAFAAMGRNLALCARRADRLTALRDELVAAHPGIAVHVRELDVDDHEAVFTVFRAFREDLGGRVDRVVVNAGIGNGAPIGSGRFDANLRTARTNFVSALAQCEAAMEIFREQNDGHLVTVASIAALRGLPRSMTTYAATKAALASLSEGIRADVRRTPIAVTTLYPGYVHTELNSGSGPLMVSTEKGVRAMVAAIEKERANARVPAWPWRPLGTALRHLPLSVISRFT